MERTWNNGLCPDCGEAPTRVNDTFLQCKCSDKKWQNVAGIEGTPQESEFLSEHGFHLAGDIRGDKYYLGSMNRILWLYADGKWSALPQPSEGMTFEQYVKASSLKELLMEEVSEKSLG
jgi:hypothetical protein